MLQNQNVSAANLRFGGFAGILAFLFLPGVALQMDTGWFPEEALASGTMGQWVDMIASNPYLSLLGVGFSIISILCFFPFVLTFYRLLPREHWQTSAGLAAYFGGIPLALVAFTIGYGFTWAIIDLYNSTGQETELGNIAAMGMRGYLFCDDLATSLIGAGHAFFAWVALKHRILPKWLCWEGIIGGILVSLVLFRYFIPIFAIASVGYPLIILFITITGILFLRKAAQIPKT